MPVMSLDLGTEYIYVALFVSVNCNFDAVLFISLLLYSCIEPTVICLTLIIASAFIHQSNF